MRTSMLALVIACIIAAPSVSRAQERAQHGVHHGEMQAHGTMMQMEQGMMGMNGMMLPGPTFLLEQKDALDLSGDQVQRLESMKSQLSELYQAHMNKVGPLHERAMEAIHSDQPDLAAYESALRSLADEHVQMQVEVARVSQNSLALLTETQRSNVHFGFRLMHGMRERMMQQRQMMQRMMEGGMMGSGQGGR